MWYEAFWISTSILAATVGMLTFLVWLLAARVPTEETLFTVGNALIDAKIKDFGLTSSGAGGRPPEGMLDKLLAIPGVQSYIGNMLKNMGGGQGGMGGVIGP